MSLDSLVSELVDERSLEALEKLTSSRNEEVLYALVEAAGQIVAADHGDDNDDAILEGVRSHLVDSKAVGILIDALNLVDPSAREFSLSCLSEIADPIAIPEMIALLKDSDEGVRNAAAAHLALLTKYDFGHDAKKWREWDHKRVAGLLEQIVEDREDMARRLKMQMRRKKTKDEQEIR